MARAWKHAAEWALARSGLPTLVQSMHAPSGVILAYHNVVPEGEPVAGDVPLHIDQRDFASHLDLLVATHEVVPLEELVAERTHRRDRPRVAITFDDGYQGAVTAGVEELVSRALPATFFVAPGMLGTEAFWWDLLAAEPGQPLPGPVRRHALQGLEGRQAAVLDWATREGLGTVAPPEHARPTTPDELVARASAPGMSVGAHTWSHPNLAALDRAACVDECRRSLEWVNARAPRPSSWLAYPYGLHGPVAIEEARRVFDGAVLVEGGHAVRRGRPLHDLFQTPRINIPRGLRVDGLRLRLSGLRRS